MTKHIKSGNIGSDALRSRSGVTGPGDFVRTYMRASEEDVVCFAT